MPFYSFLRFSYLFILILTLVMPVRSEIRIQTGEQQGAKFTIATPPEWNGKLLLIAHGLRQIDAPLVAALDMESEFNSQLLSSGWMIATSSYRRNGYIVDDAITDLDLLAKHLSEVHGSPERIIVHGTSMGGRIAVRMAERTDPELPQYDGFIAVGAALEVSEEPDRKRDINFNPGKPILFVSNQTELGDPVTYCLRASSAEIAPTIWGIIRDGHCNVLDSEGVDAVMAMDEWISTGQIDRFRNATKKPEKRASVVKFENGNAISKVTKIHPAYGNISTEFLEEDLQKAGIRSGSHFNMKAGEKVFQVFYGTTYSDVEEGEWIAFHEAEGELIIALNFASAADATDCSIEDEITISRIEK